ncbi:MAG: DNA circularization N-terminal domain-containing protein [Myxococcota bacterium]
MSWEDRIQEAAYTSPSGTRIRFAYESVARETAKRTTGFEFPGVDGAYVQDSGFGARRYPLRCFFSGEDHDLEATAFEAALLERGTGRLEHPLYGTFDVVPFGDIKRRDDLKRAANQTVVEVTWWSTVGAIYPSLRADPRSEVVAALDGFDVAASQQFADSVDLSTVAARANVQTRWEGFLAEVSGALGELSEGTLRINREFRDVQRAINRGLDVLVGQPLELARQTVNLVTLPSRTAAGIRSRLEGYADLAERIRDSAASAPWEALVGGVVIPGRRRQVANDFHSSLLFVTSSVAGSTRSTVEATFRSRPHAIDAAETVLSQLEDAVSWADQGFEALSAVDLSQVDTGAGYQALQKAAALAAGFLVEISFSLVPERRIVLDRDRTIIDLAAELYGQVDGRLDFLIETNDLSGSEILELPRGKTILYYA